MPIGTAFHERTFALCHSLNYREWSGYYTVSVYEVHHEHEYNAIRNACALIDITPLYKYLVTGKDATKLVNRVITRDINKVAVGQVIYACWCDEEGKVVDDGTITRLEENKFRWTAADPSLRWFRQNGLNMDVQIEDISEQTAALAPIAQFVAANLPIISTTTSSQWFEYNSQNYTGSQEMICSREDNRWINTTGVTLSADRSGGSSM